MKFLAFLLFAFPFVSFGQVDSAEFRRTDVYRSADAVIRTLVAPVRWKRKDWATFGVAAAGTVVISALDDPARRLMTSYHSVPLDRLERIGYHYGKPYSAVIFSGGFYLAGLVLNDEWAKETGMILASALTVNNAAVTLMKNVLGRARPSSNLGPYHWAPLTSEYDFRSLPSGHTAVAMTITMVVAHRIKSTPLKIFFYSLALTTAASRMYQDAHWLSDIAAATAITWYGTKAVQRRITQSRVRSQARGSAFHLNVAPYPKGLTLRGSW